MYGISHVKYITIIKKKPVALAGVRTHDLTTPDITRPAY